MRTIALVRLSLWLSFPPPLPPPSGSAPGRPISPPPGRSPANRSGSGCASSSATDRSCSISIPRRLPRAARWRPGPFRRQPPSSEGGSARDRNVRRRSAHLARFSVEACRNAFPVATAAPATIAAYDVRSPSAPGLTNRTSYVIAPDGRIIYAFSDLNWNNHVANTLAAVRAWRARIGAADRRTADELVRQIDLDNRGLVGDRRGARRGARRRGRRLDPLGPPPRRARRAGRATCRRPSHPAVRGDRLGGACAGRSRPPGRGATASTSWSTMPGSASAAWRSTPSRKSIAADRDRPARADPADPASCRSWPSGGGAISSRSRRSPAGSGTPLRTGYCAAKHGLIGYFDALRAEVEKAYGIGVTNVLPGSVRTNVSVNALQGDGSRRGVSDVNIEHGMDPAECARRILAGVAAGAPRAHRRRGHGGRGRRASPAGSRAPVRPPRPRRRAARRPARSRRRRGLAARAGTDQPPRRADRTRAA